jgi:hypothetical protein
MMRTYRSIRATVLAGVVMLTPAGADELILRDRALKQVIVTESARAFYVRVPEKGSVEVLPKDSLAGEVRVTIALEGERERLREVWRENFAPRRDAVRARHQAEAERSEAVQERRELGRRMAEEDVRRIAVRDPTFDRRDRRWRREAPDEDMLRLLLSSDDTSVITLAAADSQLVDLFVNKRLAERVKEAWLRQGWAKKDPAEQEQALVVVTAVVQREAKTSIERSATMAYIQRHVKEWQ